MCIHTHHLTITLSLCLSMPTVPHFVNMRMYTPTHHHLTITLTLRLCMPRGDKFYMHVHTQDTPPPNNPTITLTLSLSMPRVIWKRMTDPSQKNRSQRRRRTFMWTTLANSVRNQCRLIRESSEIMHSACVLVASTRSTHIIVIQHTHKN